MRKHKEKKKQEPTKEKWQLCNIFCDCFVLFLSHTKLLTVLDRDLRQEIRQKQIDP